MIKTTAQSTPPVAAPNGSGQNPIKILYVVTEDWYFCSHRLPTARAARDLGYEVVVATHVGTHADAIRSEGFRVVPLPPMRGAKGLRGHLATLLGLAALYRREKPDIVHHIALVPTFFGSVAVLLAGIGHSVSTMTGLGLVFTSDRPKVRLLRAVVKPVLRLVLSLQRHDMIFQNHDDRDFFIREKIVPKPRAHLIPGSGVDTEVFHPSPEPDGIVTAAFVGRMLRPKGVLDIVAAARLLRQQGAKVRIVLVGTPDNLNPESLSEDDLKGWQAEGLLEWWGFRNDIATIWSQAHIALLPSYREGFPKSLLEAAACGRPMIASDVPGCREIVRPGTTGLLVPLRDGAALAEAIRTLAENTALRRRMGIAARAQVEAEFSNKQIAAQMQSLYRHHLAERQSRRPR
ncbi:glycosyltransferase family 4 protein [Magnetospirillum molischianum]|uniref:Alpha-D-QuiNAc alpha-1,3-galactosyltransferase n=1 Tax=Magnetospirillum molischianum DSM 120 TaxID=1150626 RepID=H8FQ90_MAGML|nr:glycosyltransferase family 4 protein [Magnetospirillum molischianum]CCG40528.1 Alpha-D-QuiNAc alpha-1,3-galactosyltransferase [Magnetospirillum molischianum DSM 120]